MKRVSFIYEVFAEIEMTLEEVECLREIAASHYDHVCRNAAEVGGFLWGWKNQTTPIDGIPSMVPVRASYRELSTCIKILEQAVYVLFAHNRPAFVGSMDLSQKIRAICAELATESCRLAG